MNHMTVETMHVASDLRRMPIGLPEVQIERPGVVMPAVAVGVAPRPFIGPEPYFPEIDEDRPLGPYRIAGVDPHWIEKIEGKGLAWRTPITNLPQNVPTSATVPWRVSMVRPPERFGPYTVRVHNGGVV